LGEALLFQQILVPSTMRSCLKGSDSGVYAHSMVRKLLTAEL
jgi:hypothetical protein